MVEHFARLLRAKAAADGKTAARSDLTTALNGIAAADATLAAAVATHKATVAPLKNTESEANYRWQLAITGEDFLAHAAAQDLADLGL